MPTNTTSVQQSPKQKDKPEKYTGYVPMDSMELKTCREKMGRMQTELAAELGLPYRTYQDYEGNRSRIPGPVAVAVRLLLERDQWVTRFAVESSASKYEERHIQVVERLLRRQRMEG
jgi:DNA-binding transcriptional regulator YiaG